MSTITYFAYGSNMNPKQMATRCPGAVAIGIGTLPEYRFIINDRGVATTLPDKAAEVLGVLWQLNDGHETTLDRYEGYRKGFYDKCFREVTLGNKTIKAMVYIDHRKVSLGVPRNGYLEGIVAGAEEYKLPERYVRMLRSWPRERSFRAFKHYINEVKTGRIFKPYARCYREPLIAWLREHQDEILLKALDNDVFYETALQEERFLLTAMEHFTTITEELEKHQVNEQVFEHKATGCFRAHLEGIRNEIRADMPVLDAMQGDLGTEGIIITSDPNRAHGEGDRVIVTPHAPAIEWLWERMFSGDHGIHPRMYLFIEVFANTTEAYTGDRPDRLLNEIIAAVLTMLDEEKV